MKTDDTLLEKYDYSSDIKLKEHFHAWDEKIRQEIMNYAPMSSYGRILMSHLVRVSREGANFLRILGFGDVAANNFKAALLFHDLGKIHPFYEPGIWSIKNQPTKEQRVLKKKESGLGAEMLKSFAEKYGLIEHPHIKVRHAVTLYHHERINGQGTEKVDASMLPVFVQAACIVDTYDGDLIYRPHQSRPRTPSEALLRMLGDEKSDGKYTGAFNRDLLLRYIRMKERELGIKVL